MSLGSLIPEAASRQAEDVDELILAVLVVCLAFLALVTTAIAWFCVRYRRARHPTALAVPDSTRLELAWIAGPALIGVAVFVAGAVPYVRSASPPEGAVAIDVTGQQWFWTAVHRTGRKEHGSVHVPAGRPVVLNLISVDVIHSFFVPALRTKRDAVPGRYSTLWFEVEEPGRYRILCAEYCGTGHSRMIGELVVVGEEEYARFLERGEQETDRVASGRRLFERYGCGSCHAEGSGLGPPLEGLAGASVRLADGETVVADRRHLRESILRPSRRITAGYPPIMPTYAGAFSEEQLGALLAWIEAGAPGAGDGEAP